MHQQPLQVCQAIITGPPASAVKFTIQRHVAGVALPLQQVVITRDLPSSPAPASRQQQPITGDAPVSMCARHCVASQCVQESPASVLTGPSSCNEAWAACRQAHASMLSSLRHLFTRELCSHLRLSPSGRGCRRTHRRCCRHQHGRCDCTQQAGGCSHCAQAVAPRNWRRI
jgi:hypothetical protein